MEKLPPLGQNKSSLQSSQLTGVGKVYRHEEAVKNYKFYEQMKDKEKQMMNIIKGKGPNIYQEAVVPRPGEFLVVSTNKKVNKTEGLLPIEAILDKSQRPVTAQMQIRPESAASTIQVQKGRPQSAHPSKRPLSATMTLKPKRPPTAGSSYLGNQGQTQETKLGDYQDIPEIEEIEDPPGISTLTQNLKSITKRQKTDMLISSTQLMLSMNTQNSTSRPGTAAIRPGTAQVQRPGTAQTVFLRPQTAQIQKAQSALPQKSQQGIKQAREQGKPQITEKPHNYLIPEKQKKRASSVKPKAPMSYQKTVTAKHSPFMVNNPIQIETKKVQEISFKYEPPLQHTPGDKGYTKLESFDAFKELKKQGPQILNKFLYEPQNFLNVELYDPVSDYEHPLTIIKNRTEKFGMCKAKSK